MRCHLILNPRSHGGRSGRQFEAIFSLMQQYNLEFDYSIAETYHAIKEASIAAQSGDHDAIIAVGGDGTINAVMSGFYNENGNIRSGKAMGVIYTGTSPDFCKSYGIPLDLAKAVNTIKEGKMRKIGVGRIELGTKSGGRETRYFSCCASIGIGAMVAGKANRYRKYIGDTAGTLAAIFSSLAGFRSREMMIKTGEGNISLSRVTNVFVGRTKYIASGLKVEEGIADDDDRFYIIGVHNLDLLRLPGVLRQLYSGRISDSASIKLLYSNEVSLDSGKETTHVEFDGDPAGFTPCSIKAAGSSLTLLVSKNVG